MAKVGNFTKETLKNGAKVIGGHRVKYVSEDKEFIILLTAYGKYQGFYLTYQGDGAHVDEDRTPRPCPELAFDSLEKCKRHFKVGEFSEDNVTVEMNPFIGKFSYFKKKYPNSLLLFRKGDWYKSYNEDAEVVSDVCGITPILKGNEKLATFPVSSLDDILPRLVKAGHKIALCDEIESPKEQKPTRKVTENYEAPAKAKVVSIASPIESKGMEAMREAFVKVCDEQKIDIDKTCIKQSKDDTSHGTLVGYKDKKQVVELAWVRKEDGKERKYYLG